MLDPLVKTIDVPCTQAMAFDVFIAEMDTWWPLGIFTTSAMNGAPARGIQIEAREGGTIIEIGSDGTETLWGHIEHYEPHHRLALRFHIPRPGEEVDQRSLVEVTFTPLSLSETRVQLAQSDWEAFGSRAKDMQGGYGGGWDKIFTIAYKSACETRASYQEG